MQKLHVKARLVSIELDVVDFKAGFGRAVREERVGVGGGAEGSAVPVTKGRLVNLSVDGVNSAVPTENPIVVRLLEEVKIAVAGIIHVVKVNVVIPSSDNHTTLRDILHKVIFIPILNGEPLVWVDGRPDEIAVVMVGRGVAVQNVVPVFCDFNGCVNNA